MDSTRSSLAPSTSSTESRLEILGVPVPFSSLRTVSIETEAAKAEIVLCQTPANALLTYVHSELLREIHLFSSP